MGINFHGHETGGAGLSGLESDATTDARRFDRTEERPKERPRLFKGSTGSKYPSDSRDEDRAGKDNPMADDARKGTRTRIEKNTERKHYRKRRHGFHYCICYINSDDEKMGVDLIDNNDCKCIKAYARA